MKKLSVCKKITAALSAAVITGSAFAALPAAPAQAADTKILVLGDSISEGYGLAENEHGYYDFLADVMGGTVTNLAKSGDKTTDLIEKLDTDEFRQAVAGADFISISVGGNDLLTPALAYVGTLQKDGESLFDTVTRIAKEGDATTFVTNLTRELRPARNGAKTNYQTIESKIRALNPDAKVIFQTLYNPFEVPDSFFTEHGYSSDTVSKYETLMTYVGNMIEAMNKPIRALEQSDYADIYADFSGSGWIYDRILDKDVHPTPAGHALIAASVLKAGGITTGESPRMTLAIDNMKIAEYKQIPANDLTLMKTYFGQYGKLLGDVNGDGRIQSGDAQDLLKIYLATVVGEPLETQITTYQMTAGDIDGDKEITAKDAQYILRYFLNNYVLDDEVSWSEIIGN